MKSWRHILLGLIWLVAICCGLGILCVYDFTPGKDTGGAPKHWDASSGIPHSPDKATLVMFAHPQCPCTRASIGELAQLMAKCQGRVNAYVMFYHPSGTREDWAHTDLWESARTIPGVVVKGDEDGKEARRFEASTSGRVVV